MSDPVDAGNVKQVEQHQRSAKLRREEEVEHLRSVLGTVSGRAVLWRLLSDCGIYRLSYHNNPQETAFREGKRSHGLALLADIQQAVPSAYVQMQQEASVRERSKGGL